MNFSLKLPYRYQYFFRVTSLFFVIQNLIRLLLVLNSKPSFEESLYIFFRGIFWDLQAWSFLGLIPIIFACALPETIWKKVEGSRINKLITFVPIYIMCFVGFCELTFWDEFHSRFNFIAVDYLVYTNEVIANINESFPMPIILSSIFIFSCLLVFGVHRVRISPQEHQLHRPVVLAFGILLPVITGLVIAPVLNDSESNFRNDQLARNGWVEFFRAFQSNSIDYKNFYPTISSEDAKLFVERNRESIIGSSLKIRTKPNVVMIVVESLGAKFISPLGGQENTTPFLNNLSDRSIFLENLYATGTRTVRGLEAINLSIPPTPGYAVVKRPKHKNLFSLGYTFKKNGYEPIFLYGGRGFFDNMNSFFEGNGFRSVDQTDFAKTEITFSNAWGVCDEDLFKKALSIMDNPDSGAPKLLLMLTTSNHRPFTYPDGKIDIPSGKSRAGAVKYTDFAIGKFIEESLKHSWAKNTIFVIVADHSTEGRGRFDLEMTDFHIPMWIYSPKLLSPNRIKKMVSQIDILPSLIDILGLKDNSPFFGRSMFAISESEERAFIGNYQYVGYYKDKVLTTLGPNKKIRSYSYDPISKKQKNLMESPYQNEAISYYQYASEMLDTGKYFITKPEVSQR